MAFTPTPNDQPDWLGSSSPFGDPLDIVAGNMVGNNFGKQVESGNTPTTVMTIESNNVSNAANIILSFLATDGLTVINAISVAQVSGLCSGTIVIPNIGPIQQVNVGVGTLGAGGSVNVFTWHCEVDTDFISTAAQTPIMGGSRTVPANSTVFVNCATVGAGDATLVIIPAAQSWGALLYGFSILNDVIMGLGASASAEPQSVQFRMPGRNPTLALTNNDAVARTIIFTLTV